MLSSLVSRDVYRRDMTHSILLCKQDEWRLAQLFFVVVRNQMSDYNTVASPKIVYEFDHNVCEIINFVGC